MSRRNFMAYEILKNGYMNGSIVDIHGGYDYFATTLTISPLKNARKLNEIGEEEGEKYGIKWLWSDFKKKNGYKRSVELSAEYGLYRQDYCGCVYSKMEREGQKKAFSARKIEKT